MNIVLAHGILGFRKILFVHYFNGVKKHLEAEFIDIPVRVHVTEVDPDGSVIERGDSLAPQIIAALGDGRLDPARKTHIIAHSMGGLDSRYILSANKENISSRISSLTTISTPHQGSPVADLLHSKVDEEKSSFFGRTLESQLRNIIEGLGLSLKGLEDLTTSKTSKFNKDFPNHNNVRYFSIAGQGRGGRHKTSKLFFPTRTYLDKVTHEPNDGLVTVSSASRGESEPVLWPADHADEVGHDLDRGFLSKPTHFDHLDEYSNIVKRLLQIK